MSEVTSDPKFVPSAESLAVVGIKVGQIRTDAALVEFVKELQEGRKITDAQEAVAVYTARKRGHDYAWCLTELSLSEHTAQRREVEGMAILRMQEITRTVAAIRSVELGAKVVDEITASSGSVEDRITKLEDAALGRFLQRDFKAEGKDDIPSEVIASMIEKAKAQVERNVEPLTAANLIKAVPHFTEELGLTKKVNKRSPQETVTGPMGLEFNLTKALADVKAIEEATNGAKYVPTPQDYKALFDLCAYIDVTLDVSPAVAEAIDSLVSA